jgi:hypothetical protein
MKEKRRTIDRIKKVEGLKTKISIMCVDVGIRMHSKTRLQ